MHAWRAPSTSSFFSVLLLLFLHLGCFTLFSNSSPDKEQLQGSPPAKRRKMRLLSLSVPSFLRTLFSLTAAKPGSHACECDQPISTTAADDHHQVEVERLEPDPLSPTADSCSRSGGSNIVSKKKKRSSAASSSSSSILPCTVCGEVVSRPQLLELHQTTKHSLSELRDGESESGRNIIQIIFQSGWKGKSPPLIHRILKIHNAPRTLARFEEYREMVRSRAARQSQSGRHARCIADGNERLRFYCSTILCSSVTVCGSPYCSTCAIVRHGGFTEKQAELDGISTYASSWGAHLSLPSDLEEEFAFLHVRRAMLVCRVVAGRVDQGAAAGAGGLFDSVVPAHARAGASLDDDEEELLVFNPRALLPCFVIIYTASS